MIRARVKPRRFDEKRGCYVYDVSFKTGAELTPRAAKVAEVFGLGVDSSREQVLLRDFELRLSSGDVVYITGESGSGKSVLLRAIKDDLGERAIDLSEVTVDPEKSIIETVGVDLKDALNLLSRVGLNDAYLFLRCYRELSEGQKYRYRIARMISSGKHFWLADEFCSNLDRTTAMIVAYNIRRLARHFGATLIVATSHSDLGDDLSPTILIRKGWGEEVSIEYRVGCEPTLCSAIKGIEIREGKLPDYYKLSWLHYRESKVMAPLKIFAAERDGELAGVITYSYPGVNAAGRKKAVGYCPRLQELNRDWAVVSRVIVHPKYRSTGLGVRLLKETLERVGRRHVELIAVMAEYNPFAERAGMKLITNTTPDPSIIRGIDALSGLGFNPQFMASNSFNMERLRELDAADIDRARSILLSLGRSYYKRIASCGSPYPTKHQMEAWLKLQPVERLAHCLQNLAVLGQGKAYLYWCRDWKEK